MVSRLGAFFFDFFLFTLFFFMLVFFLSLAVFVLAFKLSFFTSLAVFVFAFLILFFISLVIFGLGLLIFILSLVIYVIAVEIFISTPVVFRVAPLLKATLSLWEFSALILGCSRLPPDLGREGFPHFLVYFGYVLKYPLVRKTPVELELPTASWQERRGLLWCFPL